MISNTNYLTMKTRSQAKTEAVLGLEPNPLFEPRSHNIKQTYAKIYPEFTIDFDEASAAWRANKRSIGNGMYKYICEHFSMAGKQCSAAVAPADSAFCRKHTPKKQK